MSQKYPNLQLIVVDGGSSDNSKKIIKKYSNQISWWVSERDTGQTNALNKGFSHATGDILAWLNSDDCHLPHTLFTIAQYMTVNPEVDIVYGHRVLIDENDMDIGRWVLPHHDDKVLLWADFIPQETLFWRRTIWEKVGSKLDESFNFAMDWDLLLRFREVNAKMVRLPYYLGLFRIHSQQKTITHIEQIGGIEMKKLRHRYLGKIPSQLQCALGVMKYLIKARLLEVIWKNKNIMSGIV